MPIPKPTDNETQSEFLSRCMADETMRREYPDSSQRYAVCRSQSGNRSSEAEAIEKPTSEG